LADGQKAPSYAPEIAGLDRTNSGLWLEGEAMCAFRRLDESTRPHG